MSWKLATKSGSFPILLMVIRDFHLFGAPILPDEADAPLVVDPNRMLSNPVLNVERIGLRGAREAALRMASREGEGAFVRLAAPHLPR